MGIRHINKRKKKKRTKRPAYVYTLNLSNGRKYVGMTNNPSRRFSQHFSGNGARWTQKYHPMNVMSVKKYSSRSSALCGEKRQYTAIKKQYGKHYVRGANHCSSYEKICYNCGQPGHYANRCKSKRKTFY